MVQRAAETAVNWVQAHLDALHTSSWLSSHFRENFQDPMAVDVTPERVIAVLQKAGIKFVLMGTHALNSYRDEARATQDVDILVRKKDVAKAVKTLSNAFPSLTTRDTPVVTRFVDPITDKVVLDVMKPTQGLLKVVFRHTMPVGDSYLIPDLEMALAAKFAAMVPPHRRLDKKYVDAGDFANAVINNRQSIDLKKIKELAEKVYPGGGIEILKLIADIDANRQLRF